MVLVFLQVGKIHTCQILWIITMVVSLNDILSTNSRLSNEEYNVPHSTTFCYSDAFVQTVPLDTSTPMQTDSVTKQILCLSTQYPEQKKGYAQTDRVLMAEFDQQTDAVFCSDIGSQCSPFPG